MKLYVVAFDAKEAKALAQIIGWKSRKDAEAHLARVKAPPTDPFYAAQYHVYEVQIAEQLRLGEEAS